MWADSEKVMLFIGYHSTDTLPLRAGDEVVVPAGVSIRSTHPKRKLWTTQRAQKRRINHVLPGRSINIGINIGQGNREHYPGFADWFRLYDEISRHAENHQFATPERRIQAFRFIYDFSIPAMNPQVVWAGSGQYWCEADINAVLGHSIDTSVPNPITLLDSYLEIAS